MPGNLISINERKELTWYVGDSKMDKLIESLNRVGFKWVPKDLTNKSHSADPASCVVDDE